MLRLIMFAASLIASAWLAVHAPAVAAERTAVLQVQNVSCVSCGPIVKRALSRVPGVRSVDLTLSGTSGTATVVYDDARTEPAALVAATVGAGFPSRVAQ